MQTAPAQSKPRRRGRFDGVRSLNDPRHNLNRLLGVVLMAEERKRAVALFRERMDTARGTGA